MGQYGSYEKQVISKALAVAEPTGINMNAAANTVAFLSRPFYEPACVTRFGYQVTTAFVYGTTPTEGVLTLYRYPGGDASAKIALGTIVLQDALAANAVAYADVDNAYVPATYVDGVLTVRARNKADLDVGDVVATWVTTMANGGTETGVYQPYICVHPRAEVEDNQALMHNLTP